MPIKTVIFLGLFVICAVGALAYPVLGVLAYMADYCIGPTAQWWSEPIQSWGIRYSFVLGAATGIGLLLNWRHLRFGKKLLVGQEKLMLLFVLVVWCSVALGEGTVATDNLTLDHLSVKVTKLVIFSLMLTHVVTRMEMLDLVLWFLVVMALALGVQAYYAPDGSFINGRLERLGGPDFQEANVIGAGLGTMLPLIGVQFLRSAWIGKAICLVAGVFATNGIILTRSRGAIVAVAVGAAAALVLCPARLRKVVLVGLIVAGLGGYRLCDPATFERADTITAPEEGRDFSAQSRIEIWQGGVEMLMANPFGVGIGNYIQSIGRYQPAHPGRDAHNAFVLCAGELGFSGIVLFVALIIGALVILHRSARRAGALPPAQSRDVECISWGLAVSLCVFLAAGLTMSVTYKDFLWWLFALPVCLQRAVDNRLDRAHEEKTLHGWSSRVTAFLQGRKGSV
jgi:putative inorganic carbon (HCO3(-)) transporter